ncbi:AP-4 complex subunit mu-1-like protein, partial [Trifolium pratense]
MISQFFVLSQRGDNIVFRDYRGEVQKGSPETFFRKVKFWKEDADGDAPPVFVDGVNYFHVKVAGLLFVATTRINVSPSLVLELLQRTARVIKDYLGVLNEDSFRKNFVLVYELLDEVI